MGRTRRGWSGGRGETIDGMCERRCDVDAVQ